MVVEMCFCDGVVCCCCVVNVLYCDEVCEDFDCVEWCVGGGCWWCYEVFEVYCCVL